MLKLNKRKKEILQNLIKGKGQFTTPKIPKEKKENNFDDLVQLYLKGLLMFQREYNIPFVGPSNEHLVRYKWYVITVDRKKKLSDIKKVLKAGVCG